MAEVYRAYHASLDRYVAIKLLHPFLADDPEFKERFEREARNIARLRHHNIVQVFDFDFDESGESYYMVMELIDGPTLKDFLFDLASTGQKLEFDRVLHLTKAAADALAYAHRNQMIHRDVKPANLMLDNTSEGRLVLTDFGIAKIVAGGQFTASGGMVGTPAYMSPEQGMGESGDERSDLYSLGVILYQMVTGQLPFDAETPLGIILKHLNEPLPLPRTLNPEVPEWLEAIVLKSMAKEPGERFQNAAEMIQAIDSGDKGMVLVPPQAFDPTATPTTQPMLGSVPIQTGMLGNTQPIVVEQRPNWLSIATALLVLVGIVVMIGIVLGQGGTGPLASVFATTTPTEVVIVATDTDTPTATATPTDTATATDTATPTDTPSPTATATDTPSPTATPTDTPSPTATPTDTPSPTIDSTATAAFESTAAANVTATAQAQADFFATRSAITPTQDVERVLRNCDLEYTIISPPDLAQPPSADRSHPRLISNGQRFQVEVVIQNTSTCAWEAGLVFLSFVEDADLDIRPYTAACTPGRTFIDSNLTDPPLANILINERVRQGERVTITLDAKAGDSFGCYFSTWELRIPEYNLYIGDPFLIAYRGFGGR